MLQLVDRFTNKRLDQQGHGLLTRNSARTQIKNQIRINFGRRAAVSADDVVGVDLELRLAVELGVRPTA